MESTQRRRSSREFRVDVVRLATQEGVSVSQEQGFSGSRKVLAAGSVTRPAGFPGTTHR